jgi:zinc protease
VSVTPPDRSRPPPPGPLEPFRFPRVERFEVAGGLPVLYTRTEGLPVVTMSLLLPAGATREPREKAGLATLTGSVLETGTRGLDAAEIAERLESLGVRLHVGSSWEIASVEFTAVESQLEEAAKLAAHLVADATFPEGEVERIRRQQLAGIIQRRAEPRALANEMANRFIFAADSPFARPLSGMADTVTGLTRDDVVEHHRAFYTPHSSALIIAGNLAIEQARRIADEGFATWAGPSVAPVEVPATPRTPSVEVVLVERPGAVQSEIRVGHIGVARNTPDYFAILVMNTVLGGAFSSRLNLNLRERHGFTYGASSTFVMRRHPGPFLVSTAVQTEVTGAAVREILLELERIRESPAGSGEIADARQYVAGTFPLRLETTDGVASRLAEIFVHDLRDTFLNEFAERVLAVTEEDVVRVARRHIHPDRLMILVVGDPDRVRPQLESLGLGEVELVGRESIG